MSGSRRPAAVRLVNLLGCLLLTASGGFSSALGGGSGASWIQFKPASGNPWLCPWFRSSPQLGQCPNEPHTETDPATNEVGILEQKRRDRFLDFLHDLERRALSDRVVVSVAATNFGDRATSPMDDVDTPASFLNSEIQQFFASSRGATLTSYFVTEDIEHIAGDVASLLCEPEVADHIANRAQDLADYLQEDFRETIVSHEILENEGLVRDGPGVLTSYVNRRCKDQLSGSGAQFDPDDPCQGLRANQKSVYSDLFSMAFGDFKDRWHRKAIRGSKRITGTRYEFEIYPQDGKAVLGIKSKMFKAKLEYVLNKDNRLVRSPNGTLPKSGSMFCTQAVNDRWGYVTQMKEHVRHLEGLFE